jgi:hypothetical protein
MTTELPGLTPDTLPYERTIELQWWGEDGEWLAAPGHLDLDAFNDAADREYQATTSEPESLSLDFKAQHLWYVLKPFKHDDGEEVYFPCEAGTPGALPFTVIETGA